MASARRCFAIWSLATVLLMAAPARPAHAEDMPTGIGQAPEFSVSDQYGNFLSLSALKGKVVLLNFWATYCPPCVSEMPKLNALYRKLQPRGFEIIAISSDRSERYVKKFLESHHYDFKVGFDEGLIVSRRYKVFSTPATFLIDRSGAIVELIYGEKDWSDPEIVKKIERLL